MKHGLGNDSEAFDNIYIQKGGSKVNEIETVYCIYQISEYSSQSVLPKKEKINK